MAKSENIANDRRASRMLASKGNPDGLASSRGRAVTPQSKLALRAFDTLQDLKRAPSMADLERTMAPLVEDLGFRAFGAAQFYSVDGLSSPKLLFGNSGAWGQRYFEQGYSGKSMIAREMLGCRKPFSWSDVRRTRRLDDATKHILNEAGDFGFSDGLYVPWRDLDGSYRAVLLCGSTTNLSDPFLRMVAEVLGSYYGSEGNRLIDRRVDRPTLSRRQRECLLWARHGKSSADIGEILGLSFPTVDGHIAEACRKLGVRTRVQAVVEACLAGLID